MTTISKLPKAKEDLLDLWCRIASDNPRQADIYLDFIDEKLDLLASSPRMGRPYDVVIPCLLAFPVDNYMIFYRQSDIGIEVVRVLHGARDILSLLQDDPF